MDAEAVLDAIESLAQLLSAEQLSESTVSLTHASIFDAATDAFGGWDVALAAALQRALERGIEADLEDERRAPARIRPVAAATREPHPDALRPVLVATSKGYLLTAPVAGMAAGDAEPAPMPAWPADVGLPTALHDLGRPAAVYSLAEDGRLFGWDGRLIPDAEAGEGARRLGGIHGVHRWVAAGDRAQLGRHALYLSVSAQGKVKGTETSALPRPVTADGVVAVLVDSGDKLVDLLVLDGGDAVLLLASNGYGICFPMSDVRPMGLRAAGVKGMDLRPDSRVVGAVVATRHAQVMMMSAQGLAKRVPLDEFRPQSRAGLGLVAAKLGRDDELVAAVGCDEAADLAVVTSQGRVVRLPAEAVPLMGRPARGDQVMRLDRDEVVISAARLLPMEL